MLRETYLGRAGHLTFPLSVVPDSLEGFDAQGKPQLRKPKVEPTLRMLLTHTAGQSYEFFNPNSTWQRFP